MFIKWRGWDLDPRFSCSNTWIGLFFFPFGCCDPVFLDPVVSYEMRSRFYVVASHDTSRIIDNIDILTIYLASEFFYNISLF